MSKYSYDLENIKEIVKNSLNFSEVLRKLNIPKRGNNIKTIKNFIIRNNINYSHFTYEKRINKNNRKKPIEDYFNNKINIKSTSLKKLILEHNLMEYKCACCGIKEWNSKYIVLQLHHIDGNPMNNSLNNLQLLCPNCHSQTDNFSNKKKEKKIAYKLCPKCGKKINIQSNHCTKCAREMQVRTRLRNLTKDQLLNKFIELKSFRQVGKFYNVSDNCIRKRCIKLGLPSTKKGITKLISNFIV